jgi:N-acetylglucosaminyldiphosphoundecaprenol N-acetyl-beta-D-mannosaminyltransferase
MTEAELAEELAKQPVPSSEPCRLIVTVNLAHIVDLSRNAAFRQAYRFAWKVSVDGTPVLLYARFRGAALRGRLTGAGLFRDLMARLDPARHRVFFVAPREDVARLCREFLVQTRGFDPQSIETAVPELGFESDQAASDLLADRIKRHGTTHLFLGVGAPKSEIWVHGHRDRIGSCYALCIGAGLEFFVGVKKRGPEWMRAIGLEWFWRFSQEPRRLFRRYFIDSWAFIGCVIQDIRGVALLDRR